MMKLLVSLFMGLVFISTTKANDLKQMIPARVESVIDCSAWARNHYKLTVNIHCSAKAVGKIEEPNALGILLELLGQEESRGCSGLTTQTFDLYVYAPYLPHPIMLEELTILGAHQDMEITKGRPLSCTPELIKEVKDALYNEVMEMEGFAGIGIGISDGEPHIELFVTYADTPIVHYFATMYGNHYRGYKVVITNTEGGFTAF